MRSLSKRLARLEAGVVRIPATPGFPPFNDQFAAVERCFFPLLSAEDRELWLQSTKEPPRDRPEGVGALGRSFQSGRGPGTAADGDGFSRSVG